MNNDLQEKVCKIVEDYLNCHLHPVSTSERLTFDGNVEHSMVLSSDELDVEVMLVVKEK